MINHLSVDDLRAVAHAGASLDIDGASYSVDDLRAVAHALSKNAHLKVFHSDSKSVDELRAIAHARPGYVIFA